MTRSPTDDAVLALRRHLQQKKDVTVPAPSDAPSRSAPRQRGGKGRSFSLTWRRSWWRPLILGCCVLLALGLAAANWPHRQQMGVVPMVATGLGVLLVLVAVVGIWRRPPGSAPTLRARLRRWLDR